MGTITHLPGRLRVVPHRIDAEGDVLAAVSGTMLGVASGQSCEALGRSGLLAVSVPSDFGGLDIANHVLAEAVALTAAHSREVAEALVLHAAALEGIRHAGSEEQRRSAFSRVLGGERFLLAIGHAPSDAKARFFADGMGVRLEASLAVTAAALSTDWFAVPAEDPAGHESLLLVPRHTPGLAIRQSGEDGRAVLELVGVHVAADSVLALSRLADRMTASVRTLLDAARVLGEGRRSLETVLAQLARQHEATTAAALAIGWREVEIETVQALIQRAAIAIDAAQVAPAEATVAAAHRLSTVLGIAAARLETGQTATGAEDDAVVSLGRDSMTRRRDPDWSGSAGV